LVYFRARVTHCTLYKYRTWPKMTYITMCAKNETRAILNILYSCKPMTAPCNAACGSGIVTLNSPSGSTLQSDTWLWNDMSLDSPKRPPYWNSTSGFDFDHITAVDMSFCTSLQNFIQMAEKNDVMSIFKTGDLSHLGF